MLWKYLQGYSRQVVENSFIDRQQNNKNTNTPWENNQRRHSINSMKKFQTVQSQ